MLSEKLHPPCRDTRVVKRLSPDQRGALKLAQRFGNALVCVRYRQDAEGKRRYTTVELVIDEGPLLSHIVEVHIERSERGLRQLARSRGARCDPLTGRWHMPRKLARELDLLSRVVKK